MALFSEISGIVIEGKLTKKGRALPLSSQGPSKKGRRPRMWAERQEEMRRDEKIAGIGQ